VLAKKLTSIAGRFAEKKHPFSDYIRTKTGFIDDGKLRAQPQATVS